MKNKGKNCLMQVVDSEVSIIVQGPVIHHKANRKGFDSEASVTCNCLASLRNQFPRAELILSTWEGSNVNCLNYDKVCFSADPGSIIRDEIRQKYSTTNRQLISTVAGLRLATRKYSLKVRSDMYFYGPQLMSIFNRYCRLKRTGNLCFAKQRILVSNVTSFDAKAKMAPYHICDWLYFGLTCDLIDLLDIPLIPTPEFVLWYKDNPRPKHDINPTNLQRFHTESWILKSWIEKHRQLNFSHTTDISGNNIELSERILGNNLIIASPHELGFKSLVHDWDLTSRSLNYTLRSWSKLANHNNDNQTWATFMCSSIPRIQEIHLLIARHCISTGVKFDDKLTIATLLKTMLAFMAGVFFRLNRINFKYICKQIAKWQ